MNRVPASKDYDEAMKIRDQGVSKNDNSKRETENDG